MDAPPCRSPMTSGMMAGMRFNNPSQASEAARRLTTGSGFDSRDRPAWQHVVRMQPSIGAVKDYISNDIYESINTAWCGLLVPSLISCAANMPYLERQGWIVTARPPPRTLLSSPIAKDRPTRGLN